MTNIKPKILSLFSLLLFFLFTLTSCDKEEKLYNTWNLQSVSKNGEPFSDSTQLHLIPNHTYYTFHLANLFEVYASGIKSHQGFYLLENSSLKIRFTLEYRRIEIEAKIKKLTRKELNFEYKDKEDTYFLKLYGN